VRKARLQRLFDRFVIHVSDHQDIVSRRIDHDRSDQTKRIELRAKFKDRIAWFAI